MKSSLNNTNKLAHFSPEQVNQSVGCSSSMSTSSPISLPTSMQTSFESDMSFVVPPAISSKIIPPPSLPQSIPVSISASSLHGLTSTRDFNLQQLSSITEKVHISRDTPVIAEHSSNPSPTPSFNLGDLFSHDNGSNNLTISNLQALARLGNLPENQGKCV